MTNMDDHELVHMTDSKPYFVNDDVPIQNLVRHNCTEPENESEKFNYHKQFDNVTGVYDLGNDLYELI
jgi:hypothetical protein